MDEGTCGAEPGSRLRRRARANSLRQHGSLNAPFPFPLRGQAATGGFPPRRQKQAAPPEGFQSAPLPPLCILPLDGPGASRTLPPYLKRLILARRVFSRAVDNGPLSSVCRVIFDGRRNNPVAAIGNAQEALAVYPRFLRGLNLIGVTLASNGNAKRGAKC